MTTRSAPLCPVCSRPATLGARPFCSPRCADVDLGRWVTGQYRIPTQADEYEEQASDQPEC